MHGRVLIEHIEHMKGLILESPQNKIGKTPDGILKDLMKKQRRMSAALEAIADNNTNTMRVKGDGPDDGKYITEMMASYWSAQLKLKVSLYILASFFMVASCFLVVFAPEGREAVTITIAAALVILAIGIAGLSYFKIKTGVAEITARADRWDHTKIGR